MHWLFAGSLRAGRRTAATMRLLHAARLNMHEPSAHLKEVFRRQTTQPASELVRGWVTEAGSQRRGQTQNFKATPDAYDRPVTGSLTPPPTPPTHSTN